ncbi:MAG: hypothetical protein IH944_04815 [Armatimonadetes bacterium]|nr:hypothetical protein [Armatimonadota bacterium]
MSSAVVQPESAAVFNELLRRLRSVIGEADRYGASPRLEAEFSALRSGVLRVHAQLRKDVRTEFGGSDLENALATHSLEALLTRNVRQVLERLAAERLAPDQAQALGSP